MATLEEKVLDEALLLPNDRRAALVDQLLRSLNLPTGEDLDRLWAEEAERRLREIRAGEVEPVSGEQVREEVRKRFKGA
ncbi:MAG TPA: addiction module protein [Acidiferrobacteraceae bacterium]|nr:addiction module protein [Acidiferrobacteraceae bacterium]